MAVGSSITALTKLLLLPSPTNSGPSQHIRRSGIPVYSQLVGILTLRTISQCSKHVPEGSFIQPQEKVAIIGAGAGSLSLAYYLQKYTRDLYDITIFEQNDYVGGRTPTVFAYNNPQFPFELGATVFVSHKKILVQAAKEFGLKLHDPKDFNKNASKKVSISQGHEILFSFNTAGELYVHAAERYGASPIKLVYAVKDFLDKLVHVYYHKSFPFVGLTEAVNVSGLNKITGQLSLQVLLDKGISALYN